MTPDKSSLRLVGCLKDLDDTALAQIAEACVAQVVEPGTTLMSKGEEDRSVVFMLTGRARVAIYTSSGRLVHLEDAVPGMVLGELSAIGSGVRSASVEALETSLIARMPGDTFLKFLRIYPDITIGLMHLASERLRVLTDRYYESSALPVQGRLHAELLRLAQKTDTNDNSAVIEPNPTHEEIANRIGARRESVAREISRMTKLGLIAKRGRTLKILDLDVLTDLAEESRDD